MFEAIARARDHVNLQTYILEAGAIGQRLAELLIRKRAQGVRVNVLYDSVGSIKTPAEYFQQLRAAGIAVCEFNPINPLKAPRGWEINNRDHRKILVVDGRVAFTGGINISGVYSAGSFGSRRTKLASKDEGWRDTHIATRGPIVAEFQRLYLDAWTRQGCEGPAPAAYFPKVAERGDWTMRLVASDPEAGASERSRATWNACSRSMSTPRTRSRSMPGGAAGSAPASRSGSRAAGSTSSNSLSEKGTARPCIKQPQSPQPRPAARSP